MYVCMYVCSVYVCTCMHVSVPCITQLLSLVYSRHLYAMRSYRLGPILYASFVLFRFFANGVVYSGGGLLPDLAAYRFTVCGNFRRSVPDV